MRLLAFAIAIMVLAPLQNANADVALTDNTASFNFDTDGGGAGFSFIADPLRGNSLGNIEAWLRYDKLDGSSQIITEFSGAQQLLDGSSQPVPGAIAFNGITVLGDNIANPRTITPILRFALTQIDDTTAQLGYTLELNGGNFSGADPLEIEAFVSFDFLGAGSDKTDILSPEFGNAVISDASDGGIGPGLAGLQTVSGADVQASAFDVFNRGFGTPSSDRFNTTNDLALTGSNLALGHYFSFGIVPPSVADPDFSLSGSAAIGAAVPEPGTATLILLGVAGLAFRRSRS